MDDPACICNFYRKNGTFFDFFFIFCVKVKVVEKVRILVIETVLI